MLGSRKLEKRNGHIPMEVAFGVNPYDVIHGDQVSHEGVFFNLHSLSFSRDQKALLSTYEAVFLRKMKNPEFQ